jgi:hypothetical protein
MVSAKQGLDLLSQRRAECDDGCSYYSTWMPLPHQRDRATRFPSDTSAMEDCLLRLLLLLLLLIHRCWWQSFA